MSRQEIERDFPRLFDSGYSIESPATPFYNCIAWAADDATRWWWPDPMNTYYWPSAAPRTETVEAFVTAFESLGYTVCGDADYEAGFEKVSIYVNHVGEPTHAARQLTPDIWTSKIGNMEDIEHRIDGLDSPLYGRVACLMKRPV